MLQSYAGVILEKIDAKCNEIFLFKTGEEKGKLPLGFLSIEFDLKIRGYHFKSAGGR